MKNYFGLLALPALALAAAIDPRDTAASVVQIVNARPNPVNPGNACPKGDLGAAISVDKKTITLILDKNNAWIGANTPENQRERTCIYMLTVEWPLQCTKATFKVTARGTVHLADKSYGAYFQSSNVFQDTTPGQNDTQIELKGAQYAGPSGFDFKEERVVEIKRTVNNANQRQENYTMETRLFVRDNGQHESNDFGLTSLDFSFENPRSC